MRLLGLALLLSGWILALAALGASVLSHGGRFSARLDVFTHFAPFHVAMAALALLLAAPAARGGRFGLLIVSLLALASALALVVPEWTAGRRAATAVPGEPGQIKVIQFNAWGRNARADEAVRWLIAQDADIIVVQEPGRIRDRLVRDAGYHASCAGCGVVVFSKAPPALEREVNTATGDRVYIASVTFDDPRGDLTVVGVHMHWPVRFKRAALQTATLRKHLAAVSDDRTILAGDFNSTPWSFTRQRQDREFGLIRRTRGLPTWPAETVSHNRLPAPFPYMPIDHVYAGARWATVGVERGPRLGSDHYPVVVTLAPLATPPSEGVAR